MIDWAELAQETAAKTAASTVLNMGNPKKKSKNSCAPEAGASTVQDMDTSKSPAKPPRKKCSNCGKGNAVVEKDDLCYGCYWEGLGQPCVTPDCLNRPAQADGRCEPCYKIEKNGPCECPGGDLCPYPCPNASVGEHERCIPCRSDDENQCGRREFPEGYQLAMLLETVRYEPEVAPLWFPSDWYFRPCRLVPVAQRKKNGYSNELVYQSARMEEAVNWAWHRIVYEEVYGPLPEWADRVRHLCGVAACYEQTHLAAGNDAVNRFDKLLHTKLGTGANVVNDVRKATEEVVEVARRIFDLP